ncbi:hypothetical protein E2C01_056894 [Portunus trituberculatus]|uniref:Uncharacterized protein n=1 Tax=Portunus trituberculatus TaxID=210409 RepID=A0A5B7H1V6_PORTR|nr:hypothetical protein [Portunus trituberculatus]
MSIYPANATQMLHKYCTSLLPSSAAGRHPGRATRGIERGLTGAECCLVTSALPSTNCFPVRSPSRPSYLYARRAGLR